MQEERDTTTTKEVKFDDLKMETYKKYDHTNMTEKSYEVYSISEKSSFYNISSAD
jgi:hypothetical protein